MVPMQISKMYLIIKGADWPSVKEILEALLC